jgi:hypothetical protein
MLETDLAQLGMYTAVHARRAAVLAWTTAVMEDMLESDGVSLAASCPELAPDDVRLRFVLLRLALGRSAEAMQALLPRWPRLALLVAAAGSALPQDPTGRAMQSDAREQLTLLADADASQVGLFRPILQLLSGDVTPLVATVRSVSPSTPLWLVRLAAELMFGSVEPHLDSALDGDDATIALSSPCPCPVASALRASGLIPSTETDPLTLRLLHIYASDAASVRRLVEPRAGPGAFDALLGPESSLAGPAIAWALVTALSAVGVALCSSTAYAQLCASAADELALSSHWHLAAVCAACAITPIGALDLLSPFFGRFTQMEGLAFESHPALFVAEKTLCLPADVIHRCVAASFRSDWLLVPAAERYAAAGDDLAVADTLLPLAIEAAFRGPAAASQLGCLLRSCGIAPASAESEEAKSSLSFRTVSALAAWADLAVAAQSPITQTAALAQMAASACELLSVVSQDRPLTPLHAAALQQALDYSYGHLLTALPVPVAFAAPISCAAVLPETLLEFEVDSSTLSAASSVWDVACAFAPSVDGTAPLVREGLLRLALLSV